MVRARRSSSDISRAPERGQLQQTQLFLNSLENPRAHYERNFSFGSKKGQPGSAALHAAHQHLFQDTAAVPCYCIGRMDGYALQHNRICREHAAITMLNAIFVQFS